MDAVKNAAFLNAAAGSAGVHDRTMRDWLARGEEEHETGKLRRKGDTRYRDLYRDVHQADAECKVRLYGSINKAAVDGVRNETVTKKTMADGSVVTTASRA